MREIKFRAWDKMGKHMKNNFIIGGPCRSSNVRFEIMQYTGLKDKNGKEIYEGDIVNSDEVLEVVVKDFSWCLENEDEAYYFNECDIGACDEVIGNIYQDKHLLNKQPNLKPLKNLITKPKMAKTFEEKIINKFRKTLKSLDNNGWEIPDGAIMDEFEKSLSLQKKEIIKEIEKKRGIIDYFEGGIKEKLKRQIDKLITDKMLKQADSSKPKGTFRELCDLRNLINKL